MTAIEANWVYEQDSLNKTIKRHPKNDVKCIEFDPDLIEAHSCCQLQQEDEDFTHEITVS